MVSSSFGWERPAPISAVVVSDSSVSVSVPETDGGTEVEDGGMEGVGGKSGHGYLGKKGIYQGLC